MSLVALCALATALSSAREKVWEVGAGGALANLSRVMVTEFTQTPGGDYLFHLEDKHVHGVAEVYLAESLKTWLYLDIQGSLGLAGTYREGDVKSMGHSYMTGLGLQFRPFTRSPWIVPYFRLGLGFYHKDFPARYVGAFEGDPTEESQWSVQDACNKGLTADSNTFVPVSLGLGVIGWMGNRVGLRLQFQYLSPLVTFAPSFAQASAGLVFRFGEVR